MNTDFYKIPHTCWIAEWSTADDGGYEIFGRYYDDMLVRFDRVHEVDGFRCIQLVEKVRHYWVIETWLECGEGETRKKIKLITEKHLKRITKKPLIPPIKT